MTCRVWPALEPGQSVALGRAWDGSYYVRRTQTTPGDWLGPVTRTIARGATPGEAFAAEQEPER